MKWTKQAGSGKASRCVVPLLVGGAVAVASVVLLSGAPATANGKTVTVSFTADGPSPSSVTISPGDTVVYRNDVDPNGGGLLSRVGGAIKSVTVNVTNAAQSPFDLGPGQARALTYEKAVTTTYAATYRTTLVLGLLSAKTVTTTGTVTVKDSSTDSPPVVMPAAQPATQTPETGQDSSTEHQASPPTPNGQPGGQDGQTAGPAAPQVNPGDPAGGQVSYGGGQPDARPAAQPAAESPSTPEHAAPAPGGHHDDAARPDGDAKAEAVLPQIGTADQRQATASAMEHMADAQPASSMGLPAIVAVVLLSMVSAGLVRAIMVRHSAHAGLA